MDIAFVRMFLNNVRQYHLTHSTSTEPKANSRDANKAIANTGISRSGIPCGRHFQKLYSIETTRTAFIPSEYHGIIRIDFFGCGIDFGRLWLNHGRTIAEPWIEFKR